MSKFASAVKPTPPQARTSSPVRTTTEPAVNAKGAAGFVRDVRSELFLLAVANMVKEETYHESAADRDARFVALVHQATVEDPKFVAQLIPWLRNTANMRSAPLVAAVEYVRAGGPDGMLVVNSAIVRADEPAEMVGYWKATYGQADGRVRLPRAVKRGVARAAVRLYTERNVIKYDGQSSAIRFGDVLELCHPVAGDEAQSALFRHCIDRRHHRDRTDLTLLPTLTADGGLQRLPVTSRRANLDVAVAAGWPWERVAGWLPGGMDAAAWETLIPKMGYMALLRNLRNFEQAGVSPSTVADVATKLTSLDEVARCRQFPFRFFSAWKATESMTWGLMLEQALDLSTGNIPALKGRTLVLVDVSGSMNATLSAKSKVQRWETGALFAGALARKGEDVDVVAFGTNSQLIPTTKTTSVLRFIDQVRALGGRLGHSTRMFQALDQHFDGHDRVVIFTDEQTDSGTSTCLPDVPVLHIFNLGGYRVASTDTQPGRHTFGGFSDATFKVMAMVERFQSAGWDDLLTP